MESDSELELQLPKMYGFVVGLRLRLVHHHGMLVLGDALDSRSAKLHVPAAQHIDPDHGA